MKTEFNPDLAYRKMKKIKSAGGIIINKNRICLICHDTIGWVFPKGHVEKNESIKNAAIREIIEETGLKNFEVRKKLGIVNRLSKERNGKFVNKYIHLFLIISKDSNLDNCDEPCKWFTFENAVKTLKFSEEKNFLLKNKQLIKSFFNQ